MNFKQYQDVKSVAIKLQDQAVPVAADEGLKTGEVALQKINGEYNYDLKFNVFFPKEENSISCYAM